MKKELKQIIAGLCLLLVAVMAVFYGLYRMMDRQTERDVREIGRVFLEEKARQEAHRFEAIKAIRYSQMESMKRELEELDDPDDPRAVHDALVNAAKFQDLSNCSLISSSGKIETVYGEPIERLGDTAFLMDSLATETKVIVTGGWGATQQMIIYAEPLALPMLDKEMSVGLLWCKPVSFFIELMNLNDPDSLASFYIIRRDTSFVAGNGLITEETYDEMVRSHVVPEGMSAEDFLEKLHETIANNDIFMMHTRYVDEAEDINTRRSVYAMPLKDSNWYLLCILPYGVLDKTIADMGRARMTGMLVALGIITAALLIVFFLYLRITRHQMERLEAARAEAIAANKAKSDFLSNMSHDIRTPMNAIVGMTEIATENIDEKERVQDCLKKITLSSRQLLGVINDVLDMSRIESGKMTLNPEPLSLRQTMETMCEIVRPQIKAGDQQFDIIISNILAENVYCDSVRLNQILLNFLSNAMKFTPPGGMIQIDLRQAESPRGDGWVRTFLSVSDTGIGMSEEFKEKLFQAFEREDSRRVQKTQGTGLGMAITSHIVDAMGGTIEVKSKQGEGSTFLVTVDLEKVPEDTALMKLPAWKVLVVDDNEDICETAALSLTDLGCVPQICMSGEEAVERTIEAHRSGEDFFVVLIDYRLSGMNGVEAAKQIRQKVGESIPISIISAYDWADIEEEATQAGIDRFISKPLFKSTLYYALRKYQDNGLLPEEEMPEAKREDIAGMRILLAEDNELNAEIAIMILEENGCVVDHAGDGKIAAGMFDSSEPGSYDAILIDLRMPNMDGIEATKVIRAMKRPDASTVPIIAMTADAFAEDALRCREAGMNAHLAKPIDVEKLIQTLSSYKRNQS